jgi:hypothetical protein
MQERAELAISEVQIDYIWEQGSYRREGERETLKQKKIQVKGVTNGQERDRVNCEVTELGSFWNRMVRDWG